ncbi:hypothetical protein JCM5296_006787 [Sporobolomyces johnsonii]
MAAPSLAALRSQSMFDLTGVVAVVTGGSSGIGLMMSSTLLANNAKVYIVDLEPEKVDIPGFNKLAKEAGSKGEMIALRGDCGSKAEAARIAEELAKREQYVSVLFNNAGTMTGAAEQPNEPSPEAYHEHYFGLAENDFFKSFSVNT